MDSIRTIMIRQSLQHYIFESDFKESIIHGVIYRVLSNVNNLTMIVI